MWIAVISICLSAVLGITAFVRSIPVSYANMPMVDVPSKGRTAPARSEDVTVEELLSPLAARATVKRGNRASCPACGVIESMRQTESPENIRRQGAVAERFAGSNPGGAARKVYEFTVRFRDRSTMRFSEASPRAWGVGTPVVVIGSLNSANN
jgi:hypothetical protein